MTGRSALAPRLHCHLDMKSKLTRLAIVIGLLGTAECAQTGGTFNEGDDCFLFDIFHPPT